jgi:flagellar hook-length control protein FliK
MTAIAPTNPPDSQRTPAPDQAKPPPTDIFTALLATISPAPSGTHASQIGRKGAPAAQQKRPSADPIATVNPTDAAVAQLATRGPAKATVAAAQQDSTAARESAVSRPTIKSSKNLTAPGESAPKQDAGNSKDSLPAHHPISDSPTSQAVSAQANSVAAQGAAARSSTSIPPVRVVPQAGSTSTLTRLIQSTNLRGQPGAHSTPRAILRPVVAHHAQGRPTAKQTQQPQPHQRPEDPDTDFASQLSRGFSAILRQNGGSLTLHLQPQDLGEITIRMDMSPGKVAAAFEVESTQARDLLNDNLSTLRSALEARGIGVETLTINVSERSTQDAATAAEPEASGGANPDGGAQGHHRGDSGTDRPAAHIARSAPESLPEAGAAAGVDMGGAPLTVRLALDAVA